MEIFQEFFLLHSSACFFTGHKRVRQFSHPAETVRHIWLPLRLSPISCFMPWLLCLENSFLQRLSVWLSFLPRVSAGSRITQTVSAGSHFSWTVVLAGSKRSLTVLVEAKYDGQSLRGLVYTLYFCSTSMCHFFLMDYCRKNKQNGKQLVPLDYKVAV